jgi:ssDNA-binding Zn-finger/Zn-ribbon topoisomerase 1
MSQIQVCHSISVDANSKSPACRILTFVTAHCSKGLEAEHVIIPKLTRAMMGFPSRITGDPVLQLAMPGKEPYPHAEERRFFCVALTRASRTLSLIAVRGKESPFFEELEAMLGVQVDEEQLGPKQRPATPEFKQSWAPHMRCPECTAGVMVARPGKAGKYESLLGCSNFPKCRHTQALGYRVASIAKDRITVKGTGRLANWGKSASNDRPVTARLRKSRHHSTAHHAKPPSMPP